MNHHDISYAGIALAASFIALAGILSIVSRLGLAKRLWIAAARTVVQLSLVGLVLEWVFAQRQWYWVLGLAASMIVNASIAAVGRTEKRFAGIFATSLVAVTLSSALTLIVVTQVVIAVDPWYEPRYLIPLLGMILGNTLTGLSLTLDRMIANLIAERDQIEGWLALGATRWQASRELVADAMRTGLIPIVNAMSVVGIVSLPGMMTGQILGGIAPAEAVKYQIVVMFMLAGSTSLGVVVAGRLTFAALFTREHQLALERLR